MNINEISLLAGLLEARRLIEERITELAPGLLEMEAPRKPPQMDHTKDEWPEPNATLRNAARRYLGGIDTARGIDYADDNHRGGLTTAPPDGTARPPAVVEGLKSAKKPKSAKWHAAMKKRRGKPRSKK